jgi:universal stress protein A
MSFRRVIVAVDRSPIAAHAAEVGAELARSLGAELAFVHAIEPAEGVAPVDSGLPAGELMALAQQDARRLLGEFLQSLPTGLTAREFLKVGKPATEIAKAAKDWPADVIVIGSHGRSGISRVVLGSVAESVVRHATCPILVVRENT